MKITAAIDLLLSLITQAQRVSTVIQAARAEGRDSLNDEDLAELRAADDEARDELEQAIAQAEAEGR